MSDRYSAITVVLEHDIRDDDAEPILTALRQIKGVLSVTPNVASLQDHLAHERVRLEYGKKCMDLFFPPKIQPRVS